jgi:hypothetical protein
VSGRLTIKVEKRSLKSCAVLDVRRQVSSKLEVTVMGDDEIEDEPVSLELFVLVDIEDRDFNDD